MVLQLKQEKEEEGVIQVDNFFLGPPNFNKFSPLQVSSFPPRKICLLNDQLVEQVPGLQPTSQYGSTPVRGAVCTSWRGSLAGPTTTFSTPSSPAEKEHMFRQSLATISSCIYAVFIVTLGVILYTGELMSGRTPVAECFSIYLVLVGLGYFTFLYFDLRKYLRIMKISEEMALRRYDISECAAENDIESREQISNIEWSSLPEPDMVLPHYYCFTRGRHSGSFYMKVGAAGFCLGHLIHSGLLISYQIAFLMTDSVNFLRCASIATLVLDLLYPTYSFLQLFFIFKYSNVIINRFKIIGRFALMHCIGSNLCFWIWTILRETVDSLYHETDEYPESLHHLNTHKTTHTAVFDNSTSYSSSALLSKKCHGPTQFKLLFETFSPYLYPFTIEYSILVVGVLFIMWQNIGKHKHCSNAESTGENFNSNVVLYADCQSSNKGLFAGLIILAGSFLSIILFFVAMADSKYIDVGLSVNSCTELILIVLMTGTVVPLYTQITKLDVNNKAICLFDDLLLFTCIPAFFVQTILSIIPAWKSENYINLLTTVLQTVQVLIQTPFITDGLRRCSNSKSLRIQKPGRELLTFLIVLNVTMWITETFEIKSHSDIDGDPRSKYYGQFLWSVITHLTFPLTMFYRFHSSVCMVDIWKSGYVIGQ